MSSESVRHDVVADGAVHILTMDKPPGNVIDMALCAEFQERIETAAASSVGKVLIVRGAGRHFSFGASVEEHLPDKAVEMLAAVGGVIRHLISFPYPTLVGVQGSCLGGGLEVALACGIVFATQSARLAVPEITLGVLPPAATALLAGRGAEEVILTGRTLSAAEAHRWGIVNHIVADGELDSEIERFVTEHLLPRSALSLRLATRAIRSQTLADLEARLDEAERLYIDALLPTHDGTEGIKAFLEKRPPVWTNN